MRWLNPLRLIGALIGLLERFAAWAASVTEDGYRRGRGW